MRSLANITFSTERPLTTSRTPAVEFEGHEGMAKKWIATARQIFPSDLLPWFARPLYDLGWLEDKPPPPTI